MNASSLKHNLRNAGYLLLCLTVGSALSVGLWRLGVRGENQSALCSLIAIVGGIAVSRWRRQALVQGIRMASERISWFGRMWLNRRSLLVRPPASRLDRIAQLLWSTKTYERVFKPARADIIHEWQQAEVTGDRHRELLIRYVTGPASMAQHMAAQLPFSLIKMLVKLWTAAK